MTRYLSLREILTLHERIAASSGGGIGVRDLGLLESAIAQPRQSFDGSDLYPSILDKAVALGFSLISNHPFIELRGRGVNQADGTQSAAKMVTIRGDEQRC